jgi:predicted nucleic acid-binding protein
VLRRETFRPFLTAVQGERLVEALARDATIVADTDPKPVSRDPRDDYLVALARAAEAHVVVSGDADLLDLDLDDLRIAAPRDFLALLPE